MINITNEVLKDKYVKYFSKNIDHFNDVIAKSANAVMKVFTSDVKKQLPKKWGFDRETLKNKLRIKQKKAQYERTEAEVLMEGGRIGIERLSPSPTTEMTGWNVALGGKGERVRKGKGFAGRGSGIKYKFAGSSSRSLPHAFYTMRFAAQKMGEFNDGAVFQRVGAEEGKTKMVENKKGIKEQAIRKMGTSLPIAEMTFHEKFNISDAAFEKAKEKFDETFIKEADAYLKGFGAK